jgi:hypothetical protein
MNKNTEIPNKEIVEFSNEATNVIENNIPYMNVFVFFLITMLYYNFIPTTTLENVNSEKLDEEMKMSKFTYFIIILASQFFVNAYVLSKTCGGNYVDYLGQSAYFTILPWGLIFGVLILVLMYFPSIKNAFSDVAGYFYVSSDANRVITSLLKGGESVEAKGTEPSDTPVAAGPSSSADLNSDQPDNLNDAGEQIDFSEGIIDDLNEPNGPPLVGGAQTDNISLINKICGNVSVLINQLVPSNFEQYWKDLTPLFVSNYDPQNKEKLFKLVVTRDNIGEAIWFNYTAILISCLVQFQISSANCKKM